MNFTQNKFLFCKAEDWAVASATAIDDNVADKNLGKQKHQYLTALVIYICFVIIFASKT